MEIYLLGMPGSKDEFSEKVPTYVIIIVFIAFFVITSFFILLLIERIEKYQDTGTIGYFYPIFLPFIGSIIYLCLHTLILFYRDYDGRLTREKFIKNYNKRKVPKIIDIYSFNDKLVFYCKPGIIFDLWGVKIFINRELGLKLIDLYLKYGNNLQLKRTDDCIILFYENKIQSKHTEIEIEDVEFIDLIMRNQYEHINSNYINNQWKHKNKPLWRLPEFEKVYEKLSKELKDELHQLKKTKKGDIKRFQDLFNIWKNLKLEDM